MNDTTMTNIELRATWGLGTIFALRMLGMFMVLPVLSIYGMALEGANQSLIGLAIGIYGLVQAIFQIPLALISDRVGRKPLIVVGLLIFALGSIIAALTSSIWGVILGRAIQGSGAIAAPLMALLSDLTREQNRTKAMAFIGVSFGVTFTIAMALGPIITRLIGLSGLFLGVTALALTAVALTVLVVPSTNSHTMNRESGVVRGSFTKVLGNPQLLKCNVGIFCLHTILMLNFIALPPMMAKAGFVTSEQWKVYLVTMLTSFLTVIPAIIYAEIKRQIKRIFFSCMTLLLFTEIVWLLAGTHLWLIFTGTQLFFLSFNIVEALLPSLISKESPAGYKGTSMGIYSTSQFLGVAFGGTLGGCLFQLQGQWLVFLAGASIALICCLVSTTLREPPHISSLRLTLPTCLLTESQLTQHRLQAKPGVIEVLVIPEERSVYVKVDTKKTNRDTLEKTVTSLKETLENKN
ncbi:MFS transporter [Candidatus Steffania adelgidicola]|uniref:MFS transporter n=1 Tax=Candidatus Steffania adelgidicola TaxID=1076626 RepID=UPI001D00619E|nr:MFS transporter [Candidatus Steffania adelgidicola]UDG79752.1 Inner membrane transport protein YajR [Candidatus Steffania adelgidicola]